MPITERLDDITSVRQWVDAIPLHYEYTAGVAGEKFLRGLMQGKVLASYCSNCDKASLPLRIYCVDCCSETRKTVKVGPNGTVKASTRTVDSEGREVSFGFVAFPGIKGGIIHVLIGTAKTGTRVKPRFRPKKERKGAISDLLGFERVR
jgi:uncharacterized protein